MQITREMAAVLADMDYDHPDQRAGQPAFASLPDTTPVTNVFTAVHSSAQSPMNQGFIKAKFRIHHQVFRFSCADADGQTHDYFMDFCALQGADSHYCSTDAGRAKWAGMMDVLPASEVRTLPDGRRVPTRLATPLVTVSGDTTMQTYTYSNGGRQPWQRARPRKHTVRRGNKRHGPRPQRLCRRLPLRPRHVPHVQGQGWAAQRLR